MQMIVQERAAKPSGLARVSFNEKKKKNMRGKIENLSRIFYLPIERSFLPSFSQSLPTSTTANRLSYDVIGDRRNDLLREGTQGFNEPPWNR